MSKLAQPDPHAIQPRLHEPVHDRVRDEFAHGTPPELKQDLIDLVGEAQVLSTVTDLVRFATDASPYRLIPKAVVLARDTDDVAEIFAYARRSGIPVTIRAAGSSLSGQAQGDGILIEAKRHWGSWDVEDDGRRIRCRPGTLMFRGNLALAPHGYRLGPDPASAGVATVGGVVANNASGMCCGTVANSYRTITSMSFLLPSGTRINTEQAEAELRFAEAEPALAAGLLDIKREIEADPHLVARLRRKYQLKNTTGYHMESFLDASTPLEIFRRLMVGSEGTLGFISEVVFNTVRDDKHRLTGFLIFPDIHSACAAVAPFVAIGAAAVELLDRASLRAVEFKPGVPVHWRLLSEGAAGLLVEFRESSDEARDRVRVEIAGVLARLALVEPADFSPDPKRAAQFWNIRNGLLPSVGGARPSGTSLILEDVCFPPERLAEGTIDIRKLFEKHAYDGVIFGHASAGNLHFLIAPSLNSSADVARFDAFMQDVVRLVVDQYDGSLKAEHGTGRVVAPFVEHEWGAKLTGLMWRLKRLADPDGILSPGVLLSHDTSEHLRNLHTTPTVDAEIDRCIDCGFCEPVCPSRNLTLTPRQRIVVRREMMRQAPGSPVMEALLAEYQYDAISTCAGDGMCSVACPLDINTGTLMKDFRREEHSLGAEKIANGVAHHWGVMEGLARTALRVNHLTSKALGGGPARLITNVVRKIVSEELAPAWLPNIPSAAARTPATRREGAAAVYFTACVNRIFGAGPGEAAQPSLAEALLTVSARAGLPLWIPEDLAGNCCATVWHSKGYHDGNTHMANQVVESLWRWSDGGRLPVVCDASSCSYGIIHEVTEYLTPENRQKHSELKLLDSVAWAHDHLLPKLTVARKLDSLALHPVCSIYHLGLVDEFKALGAALAAEAVTPVHATCCGFAGDRGFLHPELTAAATAEQADELCGRDFDAYLSSNRTCEIGLNHATDKDYRSIIFLLEELTRPDCRL